VYQTPFLRNIQITAVILGLIPLGLYTMTIVSYALGALRLINDGALIQETNAVESLSNVDVLCTDKTGTLTANRILYHDVFAVDGDSERLKKLLGTFARGGSAQNRTSEAIIEGVDGESKTAVDEVPFSSARKWSAVSFAEGAYVLGALEMIEGQMGDTAVLHQQTSEWSDQGLRVVAFAYSPGVTQLHDGEDPVLPPLQPLGLVSFTDELRPHVKETIAGFREAGVEMKIISGDNPETVAALAKQAGMRDDIILVSGPELAAMDESQFARTAEKATVFGRITPDQKERLVDALKAGGHYVAMIGDGVNDVLSLKKADLGIAMESGSAATRGVADIVLLNDSFGAMAPAFQGGQRIVNGMQDILRLFMSRTFSVALIFLSAGFVGASVPFLPTNNAAYAAFTVGIPTVFLALWAKVGPPAENRMRRMMDLAVPASLLNMILGIAIFAVTYYLALRGVVQVSVAPEQVAEFEQFIGFELKSVSMAQQVAAGYAARSMLTPFLIFTGLILILFTQPRFRFFALAAEKTNDWKPTLMAVGLGVAFIVSMMLEPVRQFYELILLPARLYGLIGLLVVLYTLLLWVILRNRWFGRFLRV
jgi:cation-transporting ATPase E